MEIKNNLLLSRFFGIQYLVFLRSIKQRRIFSQVLFYSLFLRLLFTCTFKVGA